jgi:hypothetical protein
MSDTERITRLPVRGVPQVDMTPELALPACAEKLRPLQSAVLYEVKHLGGAVAALSMGGGKAWLAQLIPAICGARLGIVLAPKGTLANLERERARLSKHFRLVPTALLSYGKLSRPRFMDKAKTVPDPRSMLDVYAQGLKEEEIVLVADEAHRLGGFNVGSGSAQAAKVYHFLHNGDGTRNRIRFVPMSGTLAELKVQKFSHLFKWALGAYSPLPINKHDLNAWAAVLNYKEFPTSADWAKIRPLWEWVYPNTPMHTVPTAGGVREKAIGQAFQYRLRTAPGVVATSEDSQDEMPEVHFHTHTPKLPEEVVQNLRRLDVAGELPNGDLVDTPSEKWIRARQLACGYYPKLEWPDGVDIAWLTARSDWHRHVRAALTHERLPGRDSPATLRAVVETELKGGQYDRRKGIYGALEAWLPHSTKPEPERPPQWYNYWLIDWIREFIDKQHRPFLIWVDDLALQAALEPYFPVYGTGTKPDLVEEPHHAVLAMKAHSEGKNLHFSEKYQRGLWADMLVVTCRPSGKQNGQMIARIVRPGQPAPITNVHYLSVRPFNDSLREAKYQAQHALDKYGLPQTLLSGTWIP